MENKKIIFLLLGFILIIAGVFRFWKLDQIPPGLYPDVAINGNNAFDSIANGDFKVFYQDNNGREGVFFWLIALSFLIFGPSVWAMKIVAAIIGFLTVLGTYLLTKELFKISNWKNEAISLLTSFFIATSFWHTNFSRIGFRAIMVPFCLVFAFYFLFKGFNSKRLFHFIISGFFFGLGFHTYIAYRFVIFIVAPVLICWWLSIRKQELKIKKQFLISICCLLITAFVVALPIGIYFLTHPADFFGRAGGVSIFSQQNPLWALTKSLALHLGMFNFYGDANWRHNYSGAPMLPWFLGVMFIIGLIISVKKLITQVKNKNWEFAVGNCLLLSWFIFMLASGFLSEEGAPHALRVIGVIPVIYIFGAVGFFWFFSKIGKFFKTKNQIIVFYLCLVLLLISVLLGEFNKYFYLWGENKELNGAFSANYLEIGNYLNSLPESIKKYVIVNQDGVPVPLPDGIPMPAQTPMFIERAMYGRIRSTYLKPADIEKVPAEKNMVIVPLQYDENLFLHLQVLFPGGKAINDNGIWIYKL